MKSEYRVYLDGALTCATEWQPMAEAAWNRATRHRDGGLAELELDGRILASVEAGRGRSAGWPDQDTAACDLRDVLKNLLLLLRHDGWDAREIADAMTARGLPTTRARIDALRGSTPGKRTEVTPAELVVLISSILSEYKRTE